MPDSRQPSSSVQDRYWCEVDAKRAVGRRPSFPGAEPVSGGQPAYCFHHPRSGSPLSRNDPDPFPISRARGPATARGVHQRRSRAAQPLVQSRRRSRTTTAKGTTPPSSYPGRCASTGATPEQPQVGESNLVRRHVCVHGEGCSHAMHSVAHRTDHRFRRRATQRQLTESERGRPG
jgi:hypothetical protein